MCGIAGIHFKKPGAIDGPLLERFVDQLLLGIEHRGGDATGIVSVAPNGSRVVMSKEAQTASDFIKRRPSLGDGPIRTVLLHTRFATQGHQNNNANNHPVLHGTTFVTHNGHISNDDALFRENELERIAEVDSEAIAALIESKGIDKVHLALQELQGGFAIAAINPISFPDQLVLAKGPSSPLIFFENSHFIVWASTLGAIKDAWGDVLGTPPRDRKFRQLAEGQIYMFDGADGEALQFKVADKPKYQYTSYRGSGDSWYSPVTEAEKDDICFCGHRRFWHGGGLYDRDCMDKTGNNKDGCSCTDYLALKDYGGKALEKCDGCSAWLPSEDMETVAEHYSLCEECNRDYGHYFAGADWERDSAVMDGVITLEEDLSCEAQAGPAVVITPNRVSRRLELVPAPGPSSERDRWKPLFAEGDELNRHNFILSKSAEMTGFNVEFIEWILFRSDIEVVDLDAWLQTAHEECDAAYADIEKELNEIEDDIGTARMKEEVIKV